MCTFNFAPFIYNYITLLSLTVRAYAKNSSNKHTDIHNYHTVLFNLQKQQSFYLYIYKYIYIGESE